MKTQLMLVSDQAAPNLLAALDPNMKPKSAILLVTQRMTHRAHALEAVLREVGIGVSRITLQHEQDVAAIQDVLLEQLPEWENQEVVVNLTGGTKLMALAVQAVAQAAQWPSFYVDADTDCVYWIDRERKPQALSQQLRLRHYLRGYGYTLQTAPERPQPSVSWRNLVQDLILNVKSLENGLGSLNYLSQKAIGHLTVLLTPVQCADPGLTAVLQKFESAGMLKVRGKELHFSSEDARRFVNGGWLEYWVYQVVAQVTGNLGIRDKAMNVQVVDPSGQPNEMDVAFLARNRLFVIECKTARMDNPNDAKANDTLYKLAENARRIGGLGTRGLLVTYRQLRDSERRLARALQLEVVTGNELGRLNERLLQWVNPVR